jgi:multimeric flavodoxin WrbA
MVGSSKKLLIVYHSMTGGTEQMVNAAADAARAESVLTVSLLRAAEAEPADVLEADAYLFATPENLAAMSGQMKDFFDRTYYAALERINGRPFAAMICAGSDGTSAAAQIVRIALGWRLRPIADPLIVCTHAQSPQDILRPKHIGAKDLSRCAELGATLAAGAALGIF